MCSAHSPFLRHHEDNQGDHYGVHHGVHEVHEVHRSSSRYVSNVNLSFNTRLEGRFAESLGAYMAFGDNLVECTIHYCSVLGEELLVESEVYVNSNWNVGTEQGRAVEDSTGFDFGYQIRLEACITCHVRGLPGSK
jgi:hypothetical protein